MAKINVQAAERPLDAEAVEINKPGAPIKLMHPDGPPVLAVSSMTGRMSWLPEVIEHAVEKGHKALVALAESAAAFGKIQGEMRLATVESLLKMLDDIGECLLARKNGYKALKNEMIDNILIEKGVKDPRMSRNKDTGRVGVGRKGGPARYIGLATMQREALWSTKNADALRFITRGGPGVAAGIAFSAGGPRFTTPYEALVAGVPFTSVYDVWTRTIKALNDQASPPVVATKFEKLTKQAVGMTLAERQALIATLTPMVATVADPNPAPPQG